jgi:hypothetical protein
VAVNKADFACRLDLSATLTGNGGSWRILPVAHGACPGDWFAPIGIRLE